MMVEHLVTNHISLRVESSNEIQRHNKLGQYVRAALVRGSVCTPPHLANTIVSMMVLNFAGFDAPTQSFSNDGSDGDVIPQDTLLLCHNCLPQFERSEADGSEAEFGDELVGATTTKKPAMSREGLNRWMAVSVQWCGMPYSVLREGFLHPARKMLYGMSRVSVVPAGSAHQRARAHIDILATHQAERIYSLGDLQEFFNFHMRGEIDGVENNANSLIRLISPQSGQIITLWVYSARRNMELPGSGNGRPRTFSIPDSAEATWNEAVVQGRQAKGLAKVLAAALGAKVDGMRPEHIKLAADLSADLANDRILIEAIPGQRIRIIGDSLQQLVDPDAYPDSHLAKYAKQCWIHETDAGKDAWVQGFLPMHTNVLVSKPMARDINQVATVVAAKFISDHDQRPSSVQNLSTPNYSPV